MTQATWPYRFYVDYRLGGVPRWSLGEPKDARVRVPDDLLNTTVFIGGRNSDGRLEYRATGFFVGLPTTRVELGWPCLVTARHNVEKARAEFGNVWVRV